MVGLLLVLVGLRERPLVTVRVAIAAVLAALLPLLGHWPSVTDLAVAMLVLGGLTALCFGLLTRERSATRVVRATLVGLPLAAVAIEAITNDRAGAGFREYPMIIASLLGMLVATASPPRKVADAGVPLAWGRRRARP
ncbi:MAG: hypothetical protein R2939_02640 [Kofleriaceae bacterium]